ncbi:hypothetical protein KC19_8G119900 [Ceratodon purpureus]|uniref:Uncharacterized protein n=1 Tax=Ceratodon purpureus TaxID=3225 RepID=A0A8T0H618_CERPU|nr:hypothetical protein KC19_8G119900 [Ceratodon purpureus]
MAEPAASLAEAVVEALDCGPAVEDECYNKASALRLKGWAIAVIFLASALGVLIPLSGRRLNFLKPEGNPFFIAKVFAAGVILATAFIHMLPTAHDVLGNPCLPEDPWGKFAWAGFIAMLGALATLVMDFAATEFYLSRQKQQQPIEESKVDNLAGSYNVDSVEKQSKAGVSLHDVAYPHIHAQEDEDSMFTHARHVVVAQVFEFGVVAHSIIIGITIGVSNSPCTIEPLFAALTFHQFFEGFALGGCIALARFRNASALFMGFTFAITTSLGIAIGMGISTTYNENSPTALMVIGIFDSISAGILVYMALVDLIAADFLSKRMRSDRKLQIYAFVALFLGCGAMSIIGVWA